MRNFGELQNVILVGRDTLKEAVRFIAGCEFCSPGPSMVKFDRILDRVTGNALSETGYLMVECAALCPQCRRQISEKTVVKVVDC